MTTNGLLKSGEKFITALKNDGTLTTKKLSEMLGVSPKADAMTISIGPDKECRWKMSLAFKLK